MLPVPLLTELHFEGALDAIHRPRLWRSKANKLTHAPQTKRSTSRRSANRTNSSRGELANPPITIGTRLAGPQTWRAHALPWKLTHYLDL
jgi:hypothetical protein